MNREDRFETMLEEMALISDEIKKIWRSETSDMFCKAFDDSLAYIGRATENYRESCEGREKAPGSPLSDFSF